FGKRVGNFLDVRKSGDIVILEPGDSPGAIDDGDSATGNAFVGQKDAIFVADGAAWLKIGEQRIFYSHLLGKGFVRPCAVHAYAEHLRVELVKTFHVIHQTNVLVGTHRAPVERVEDEDYIFLALKFGKLHFFLALILQCEVQIGR